MATTLDRVGGWKGFVPVPDGVRDVIKKNYVTTDIQTLIIYGDTYNAERRFVQKIAKLLRGATDKETCRNIYNFVRLNVRYVKDSLNNDAVKTANVTLFDGYGDCKSMTLLTTAILRELNIPYKIRFASYDGSKRVTHVYTVAKADGQDIIIDCVYWIFNSEVAYTYFEDYYVFGDYKPANINGGIVESNGAGYGKIIFFSLLALYLWKG